MVSLVPPHPFFTVFPFVFRATEDGIVPAIPPGNSSRMLREHSLNQAIADAVGHPNRLKWQTPDDGQGRMLRSAEPSVLMTELETTKRSMAGSM